MLVGVKTGLFCLKGQKERSKMKCLNCTKIRLMLVVFVAAIVLGGGNTKADFTFGTPTNMGPTVNSPSSEHIGDISTDGLEMYVDSYRPGGQGDFDIWVNRRATIYDDWGPPENLGPVVNSPTEDDHSNLSPDRLQLYFSSSRSGGYGSYDIWVTTRASVTEPWGTPVNLGPPVNTTNAQFGGYLSHDGLELYFKQGFTGANSGLYVTKRDTKDAPWEVPVSLGPVVNSSCHWAPRISSDGLLIVFADWWFAGSPRPGGFGETDLWLSLRPTKDGDWETPVNLGPLVNTAAGEDSAVISGDGTTLYFSSNRPGGSGSFDIWQAPIIPIVDFNGDGIVDSADMCIMVDYWGTDEPLCDIGPMPWGNGIVDVQDLIVLAEHLFEEVNDPTLVAHWAFDEAEGDIAYDSAGVNDGILNDVPTWQPTSGMIDGALELDGIDDYVSTEFVLNPADGTFSVFAWIKGGAPGQAVLSQIGGVNWLCADPLESNLMTELKATGRNATELLSQTLITDGNWHRVGFVWDGAYRTR